MRIALALVFLCAALMPATVLASGIRCQNQLASEGASLLEVLHKCGPPAAKVQRLEYDEVKVKEKGEQAELSRAKTVTRTIDEWTYNLGPHDFIRVVTFVDGRLVEVESLGYGH
jgi:hypothetical protein